MSLREIPPAKIRCNPENPRIHFPVAQMEELTKSINEQGILVPLSVYYETDGRTDYVVIDGERRWRCATALNLEVVPAWVLPKPDNVKNLLTMFNIHMVREQWDDMPTAWALKALMERTGRTDPQELSKLTGLTESRVKHLQIALKQPPEYQSRIDSGEIPLNMFVELETRVIKPLAVDRPSLYAQLGEQEGITRGFVQKRLAGNLPDVVELRKVKPIIKVAAEEAGRGQQDAVRPIDLDGEIRKLVTNPDQTIDQAYENTVEMVVETDAFLRQCERLYGKLLWLLSKEPSSEERRQIRDALTTLIQQLQSAQAQLS